MRIVQPFDLSFYTIEDLLKLNKIIDAKDNNPWRASIFPQSMSSNLEQFTKLSYDKDNIITFISDSLYEEYGITILTKKEQMVSVNNGLGRKIIKCKEIGDYNNSVKRYTVLNKPLSYNKDNNAMHFLNLVRPLSVELDVIQPHLQFDPGNIFIPSTKRSPEEKLFGKDINHPHISIPKTKPTTKHNNKGIIGAIFEWINKQNIKYVYSINEWRPNIINDNYVTNLVYYTVTGSK